jgi:hypothetical protein
MVDIVKEGYDNNGNLIYREYSNGNWNKFTYDANNRKILCECPSGFTIGTFYDVNGNIQYTETTTKFGVDEWSKYRYNSDNVLFYKEYSNGNAYFCFDLLY